MTKFKTRKNGSHYPVSKKKRVKVPLTLEKKNVSLDVIKSDHKLKKEYQLYKGSGLSEDEAIRKVFKNNKLSITQLYNTQFKFKNNKGRHGVEGISIPKKRSDTLQTWIEGKVSKKQLIDPYFNKRSKTGSEMLYFPRNPGLGRYTDHNKKAKPKTNTSKASHDTPKRKPAKFKPSGKSSFFDESGKLIPAYMKAKRS